MTVVHQATIANPTVFKEYAIELFGTYDKLTLCCYDIEPVKKITDAFLDQLLFFEADKCDLSPHGSNPQIRNRRPFWYTSGARVSTTWPTSGRPVMGSVTSPRTRRLDLLRCPIISFNSVTLGPKHGILSVSIRATWTGSTSFPLYRR